MIAVGLAILRIVIYDTQIETEPGVDVKLPTTIQELEEAISSKVTDAQRLLAEAI